MATHKAEAVPPATSASKKKPRYHLGKPGDAKDIIGDAGARFQTKIAKGDPVFSLPVGRPVDALVQIAPTMLVCAISDFEADLWAGALQIWKTPNDKEQESRLLSGVKFQSGVSAIASASETCLLAGLDDGDIQVKLYRYHCMHTPVVAKTSISNHSLDCKCQPWCRDSRKASVALAS